MTGSTVNLSWAASSDDVGVARYNVHRGTSPGFTPTAGNRIGQPTAAAFADTGLGTGTYYYVVTAEDAAGNVSAASAEISATVADATPPTAPTSLAATVAGSTVNLTWTAATDNVGVARYNLHRGTTSGFTPSVANRIAQPTGTSFADLGVPAGSYFYKLTAEDAAGNVGPVSNTASATVADTTAPTAPTGLTATGGPGQAALAWTAATDNVGVLRYNVHRRTTAGFTPSAANRIAQPSAASYTDTGLAAGTYYYRVTAEDAAGNVGPASNEASAVVQPATPVGLVAAYGFDEGAGTTTADQSGSGNPGTLSNATWAGAGAGKFGNALSFNGTNSIVNVADSNSLDLTNAHDARGLGAAGGRRKRVPDRDHEGAPGQRLLRALRERLGEQQSPDRRGVRRRLPRRGRNHPAGAGRLDARRRHVRRQRPRPLRQRCPGGAARDRGLAHDLDEPSPHRRQHDLGRVVQRSDRRSPRLQPCPDGSRDPGGHERGDHEPRRRPADCARHADGDRARSPLRS